MASSRSLSGGSGSLCDLQESPLKSIGDRVHSVCLLI